MKIVKQFDGDNQFFLYVISGYRQQHGMLVVRRHVWRGRFLCEYNEKQEAAKAIDGFLDSGGRWSPYGTADNRLLSKDIDKFRFDTVEDAEAAYALNCLLENAAC